MPNSESLKMEDMSEAYVRALCAANGFTVSPRGHDNDGIDISISCNGVLQEGCPVISPQIDVQLKSSYAHIKINEDGSLRFPLKVKNYKWLIQSKRSIPIILILFHMHPEEHRWVEHTTEWLKITKCAYWINLMGEKDTDCKSTVTITIPPENVLNKEALWNLMFRAANDERL